MKLNEEINTGQIEDFTVNVEAFDINIIRSTGQFMSHAPYE
jgi:hypothetical protein